VCLGTWVSCAKTAEPIEMPFGGLTHVGSRMGWGPDVSTEGVLLRVNMCRLILTYLRISALLLLQRANLSIKRTQRTNVLAAARVTRKERRCGLLPNYFRHLLPPPQFSRDNVFSRVCLTKITQNVTGEFLVKFGLNRVWTREELIKC